ncbi:NFX1-type zinc finger-containing protein 1-like [Dendronephthya gigantea]|uniref:NFX1-type zinc finger-containing protein 1-like n=1 Tax=Dendronephthya gigantea TaxID=151771 RepID=UPI00106CADE5|nr:NFX1-type zinc finger-containing protein 1-like [Dendronephthya gigantea]
MNRKVYLSQKTDPNIADKRAGRDLREKISLSRRSVRSDNQTMNISIPSSSRTNIQQTNKRRSGARRHVTVLTQESFSPTNGRVDCQKRPKSSNKIGETRSREQLSKSDRQEVQLGGSRTSSGSRQKSSVSSTRAVAADSHMEQKRSENIERKKNDSVPRTSSRRTSPSPRSRQERKRSDWRKTYSIPKSTRVGPSSTRSNRKEAQSKQKESREESSRNKLNSTVKNESRKRKSSSFESGRSPNKKPRKNPFIRYNDRLVRLLVKDSSDILIALLDDLEDFCAFLKCDDLSGKSIDEILKVLCKVYETPHIINLNEIFNAFKDANFLKRLRYYVGRLRQDRVEETHLERIIRFFTELLTRFPSVCEDLPLDAFINMCTEQLETNQNDHIETNSNIKSSSTDECGDSVMRNEATADNVNAPGCKTSTVDEDRRNRIKEGILRLKSLQKETLIRKHDSSNMTGKKNAPPDDYKSIPIFPRHEDIFPEHPPFLRANIIQGRYIDVTHYLDVQFRLLREDYIAPIRDGVLKATGIQENQSQSIHVYKNARVVGRILDTRSGGLLHSVQFDVTRMRRVNWKNSKRFKYGSLYCLIDNNNRSCMHFVTITERNYEELAKGFINVKFFDEKLGDGISAEQQFLMIESPAYFESYRHVLKGLQDFNKDSLPFQRYLVECASQVKPPVYLVQPATKSNEPGNLEVTDRMRNDDRCHDCFNLKEALRCETAKSVPVLDLNAWPSQSKVDLNDSQYSALKAALSQEFVVIQGPPGTGKTFVGLRIANALLKNKSSWCRREAENDTGKHSPILVVCYTNHALDQFLEGILLITQSIVRVGSRGKSETLERFNLKERRKLTKQSIHYRHSKSRLRIVQAQIQEERLVVEANQAEKLGPKEVESILNDEEKEQLKQWERVAHQMRVHRIEAWLRMQDDDVKQTKQKRKSSTCNDSKAKRLRKTVDSTPNLIRERASLSVFWSFTSSTAVDSVKNAKAGLNSSSYLKEGEIPDSDLGEFHTDAKTSESKGSDIEDSVGCNEGNVMAVKGHFDRQKKDERKPNVSLGAAISEISDDDVEEGEVLDSCDDSFDNENTSSDDDDEESDIGLTLILGEQIERIGGKVEQTCQVDLKHLSADERANLYQEWRERYKKYHAKRFEDLQKDHDDTLRRMAEIESIQNERVLKEVDVIGMTTTGAAKHRLTLQEIKPRIVIVEEAAEVLEGHVITTLSSGTDHLILIGDHKQLKPKPTVFELAKKYKLDVSLFERMVKNGLTCHSLNIQHRMRPKIADIMRIIYPDLTDDVSVLDYDSVTGIQENVYFIDHNNPESENDELKSPSNRHEVEFVAALCQYLLLQGYPGNSITVLTMYSGQLLKLKRRMPKESFGDIRISSVDDYQGEECDIIILSLVRSNREGKIGFLNVSNRVCVSLSRAKKAMYCIGDISMMASKNELWGKIKKHLEHKALIGNSLPLCCPNHPETKIEASSAEDFKKSPQGGCMSMCGFRLPCGHACSLHCHPVDPKHERYRCREKCLEELCDLKHTCKSECHFGENCKQCTEMILFTVPSCKHEIRIECFKRASIVCPNPCRKKLQCRHDCGGKCGEDCSKIACQTKVERILKCGHTVSLSCSSDPKDSPCSEKCKKLLDCGHECPGDCYHCYEGRFHVKCKQPCKRLLVCSHECHEPCTKNCPPCIMDCENKCNHSKCPRPCGEPCTQCRMQCMWKCEHHQCTKRCFELCDREKCNESCKKPLKCGHKCVGICGDFCPRLCRVCNKDELQSIFLGNEDEPDALYVELVDCGHIFEVNDLDYWMEGMEENESSAVQLKVCPRCKTAIRRSLRYGNIVKKTLADIEKVKKIKLDEQQKLREKRVQLRQRVEKLIENYPTLEKKLHLKLEVIRLGEDADKYVTLENKLNFFSRLEEIHKKFLAGSEEDGLDSEDAQTPKLLKEKKRIFELLLSKRLLSVQEIKDISDSIAFLALNCQFEIMLWKIKKECSSSRLTEDIESSIESAKKIMSRQSSAVDTALAITVEERTKVADVIEDVSSKLGLVLMSLVEQNSIVKALNLSKGHWYKCRNGHIYVITECGGAMVSRKCLECGEMIGGKNHKLAEGNEVATEMDGATHSAWSDHANLLNYDPEVLRQLRQ